MPKENENPININVDDETKKGLLNLADRSGFKLNVLYEFIMIDAVKNPPQIVLDAIERRSIPDDEIEEIKED